jgi:hypothetical protein
MAVIALIGFGAGAIFLVLGDLAGDGVHCHDPGCSTWGAAVILAAFSCLLAAFCLVLPADERQAFVLRRAAGGAFAAAAVLTVPVPLGGAPIILALLAVATCSFARVWGSDNR